MKSRLIRCLLIVATAVDLIGCAGSHCIKLSGGKGDIAGGMEYCYDAPTSQKAQAPVFVCSDGETCVMVRESEAKKINALAEENAQLKAPKIGTDAAGKLETKAPAVAGGEPSKAGNAPKAIIDLMQLLRK